MKYLKTYNESFGTELEEVQWCKDVLQDLEDSGYKVSIRTYPVYGISNPGISITIDSNNGKLLPITIGEYLLTLHSYLLENGYVGFRPYDYDNPYSLSRHQVTVNAELKGVRNQFENELSQFVKMLDRFLVNAPFDSVSVSYYKPDVSPKDGDVYESIHDTKEEIEEIVSTCKDILLEAQHTFGNSDVEKSYKDDKVIISCFYKMPLDVKGKLEEYKSTMNDIHQRLIEYMTSQGFTYNNRGDRYTAYFDMRVGNITYNISFSKELDREFIGHLRYLRKYNLLKESTEQDLKDILLDLQDMGYRVIHNDDVLLAVTSEPGNVKAIVVRDVMKPSDWVELPWSELKDYALRIKDYLGDKYLDFSYRSIFAGEESKLYKKVELNEMTEIDDRIWSFAIKYKE